MVWCGKFAYAEIESLKLNLHTKINKLNLSQSLSYKPDFQKTIERERFKFRFDRKQPGSPTAALGLARDPQRDSGRTQSTRDTAWVARRVAHGARPGSRARPRSRPGNVRRGLSRAMGHARCAAWVSHATQATRMQARDPGRWSRTSLSVSGFFFFFSVLWSFGFCYIKVVNRVSKTRFPCGRHVKKYVTLDVIRPWK